MRVYEMGRKSGKTSIMVNWVKGRSDRVMITMNESERRRILTEFFTEEERPSFESRIQTAENLSKLRGRRIYLAIDNLESVLHQLFGHPVQFATLTKEPDDDGGRTISL